MSEDFKQTVDLKTELEAKKNSHRKKISPILAKPADEIEEIFKPDNKNGKNDLKKIEKFEEKKVNENVFRKAVIALAIIIVTSISYFLFFRSNNEKAPDSGLNWYAIQLASGEIYYGKIEDEKANPIVINRVYYDYDQIKKDGKVDPEYKLNENSDIRLVKLGKETYGPSGKMLIYQTQVKSASELASDSKVLKAILNYEKQD